MNALDDTQKTALHHAARHSQARKDSAETGFYRLAGGVIKHGHHEFLNPGVSRNLEDLKSLIIHIHPEITSKSLKSDGQITHVLGRHLAALVEWWRHD